MQIRYEIFFKKSGNRMLVGLTPEATGAMFSMIEAVTGIDRIFAEGLLGKGETIDSPLYLFYVKGKGKIVCAACGFEKPEVCAVLGHLYPIKGGN